MLGFLFCCIFCCFLIGAPIFVALGMGTAISIILEGNYPLILIPQRMFVGLDSWPIMAIPLFMLSGNLMEDVYKRQIYGVIILAVLFLYGRAKKEG